MGQNPFGIGDIAPDVVEKLGDGRILTRFAGGLSVVAGEHTRILFEERREDDSEGEIGIIIEPPELDREEMRQAAALYQAAGRSFEADLQAVRFPAEEAQAHGASTRDAAKTGRSEHRYGDDVQVVQYDPQSDIRDLGHCRDYSFGISAYGVTAGVTTTVCPDSISINRNEPNRFFAQWNGAVRADNPGVVVHTVARVPNGGKSRFRYKIYEYHSI
ncbi:MAG: hypothetical protein ACRD0C_13175 [Acidimicrobiia bacterium]